MKFLRYIIYLISLPVVTFVLLLLYGTFRDYRPPSEELLLHTDERPVLYDSVFQLITWNIGYGGLGAGMDFFYDGGEQVRPVREEVEQNLRGIENSLAAFGGLDFYLFQEVDIRSRRSYRIDQCARLKQLFPEHESFTAINYDVFFVPFPLTSPYGRVYSGLLTMSPHRASQAVRHAFPGNYPWPKGIFLLDRCFLVNRYPLAGGKELLVINTHNSAYDDGTLRKGQMETLRDFLLSEYRQGHYIIVGGDWNQTPAGFVPRFRNHQFDHLQVSYIEADYLPEDWTWIYDPKIPTNRRVDIPYDPCRSRTTLIDFFLISPNLEAVGSRGVDLGFLHSDHQPVVATVRIKN